MIVTRTPFRLSFFGGGSDYPQWYRQHGGAVLGATIDKYCWLVVRRPSIFGKPYKIVYAKTEVKDSVEEIEHPAVRETLADMGGVARCEIYHTSDLPAYSGVGSSSAFVVGLVKALTELEPNPMDYEWTREDVAETAVHIEQERLKETVGSQDQYLCCLGGFNVVCFPKEGLPVVKPVFWSQADAIECSQVLEQHLMLFYTGVQRIASDVASSYVDKFADHKVIIDQMVEMVDLGVDELRSIAKGGSPLEFGHLLDAAWSYKKFLSPNISTQEIDRIYTIAKENGAIGGKLLGAGGGGFLLLCVPPDNKDKVRKALSHLKEVPFHFEHEGCKVLLGG